MAEIGRTQASWLRSMGRARLDALHRRKQEAHRCAVVMGERSDVVAAAGYHRQATRIAAEIAELDPLVTQAECMDAPKPQHLATQAFARVTDPRTSYEAACKLSRGTLRKNQMAVLFALFEYAPAFDYQWMSFYQRRREDRGWPKQARSGLQTRRKELVDGKHVRDTGRRQRLENGRHAIIWELNPRVRQRIREIYEGQHAAT